jgi:iron complex outermembrane recepter protein
MAQRIAHGVAKAVSRALLAGTLAAAPAGLPLLAAEQSDELQLAEIVVTAERRETALQDTPISIIALSEEMLDAKGVSDIMDLSDFTPNLSIKGGRTGGNNAPVFSIRGIGGGGGAAGERGVAMYIDGIYVPRTSGSVLKVFDIDRIEVLRGPQGTLFGRNSEGGAIRLFTKQPGREFEAYLKGTYGNFDQQNITGSINVPIGDSLAVRAQAAYLHEDGFVERGTQQLGGNISRLGRLQLAYDVNDDIKVTLAGFYSYSHGTGSPQDIISFDLQPNLNYQGNYADWLRDALVQAGQPPLEVLNDPRIVRDDFTMPDYCFLDDFNPDWDQACALRDDNKYWQADANLQWNLSDNLKLASVTGFSKLDHDALSDNVLLGFNLAQDNVQSKSLYQELQLNATLFDGKVDAVTGLNYFNESSQSSGFNRQRRGTSVYSSTGGTANGNTGEAFVRVTNSADVDQTANSFGWFSSLTWHVTDKFNLTGGVRLAYDKKEIEATRRPGTPVDFVTVPGTDATTVKAHDSWKDVDWRGTLDYHVTDDVMVYGTVSRAHRAGAFPGFTFISCTAATPGGPLVPGSQTCPTGDQQSELYHAIPPEQVTNIEAGFRTTFFNQRLRINPTGYYMDWRDRQTTVRLACTVSADCPTGSNVFLRSTGDIDLYGVELDVQYVLLDGLTLDGGFGSTSYNIHDVVGNGGPNLFPPQASPTWNAGATYSLRNTSVGSFTFNANYSYTSSQESYPESTDPALLSDGSYKMPDYDMVNARLQWTSKGRQSMVTLYANNLLDKTYENFATKFGGGFWDGFNTQTGIRPGVGSAAAGVGAPLRNMVSVTRSRPREIGVTYQYNF